MMKLAFSGLVFLMVFLVPVQLWAQFNPLESVSKSVIDIQCLKVKATGCSGKNIPEILSTSLGLCEATVQTPACKNLTLADPTLKDSIKKCDPQNFCNETLGRAYFSLKGCLSGYGEGAYEQIKSIFDLVGDLYSGIKNNIGKNHEFLRVCDQSISCKRQLVVDHDFYGKLPDEKLDKYNAAFLQIQGANLKYIKDQYARQSLKPLTEPERLQRIEKIEKQREQAPTVPTNAKELGLIKAAEDWLEKQGTKLECFNQEARSDMICYAAAQVIDPTAAVGLLSKSARLRKLFKTVTTKERRIGSEVAYTSSIERDLLKSTLLHAEYTTEKQNLHWMSLADGPPNGKTKFVEIENSKLKSLNDDLKDKDLVTAMTNMHKQITMEEFQKLSLKYPELKFSPYSDFKSIRFAIEGNIPYGLEADLNATFKSIQEKYTFFVNKNKYVRESDIPSSWFKMGTGEMADEASAATRYSRSQSNNFTGFNYNHPEVKAKLLENLKSTESLRTQVLADLNQSASATSKLIQITPQGASTLSVETFEILRKSADAADAADRIRKKYGLTEFSEKTAAKMLDYSKSVDQFSPSLHIAKKEVASLDAAEFGGFSIDFAGMGAHNLYGTAAALAGRTEIKTGLIEARKAEKEVTKLFTERRDSVKEISQSAIGNKLNTICSGDDCVGISKAAMTEQDKRRLIDTLANQGDGSNVRVAFIQPGIKNPEARTMLATHGESIEKYLRTHLVGKMDPNRLKGMLFAVDMKTPEIGAGPIKLMTAHSPNIELTKVEKEKIANALTEAVKDLNKNLNGKNGYHIAN